MADWKKVKIEDIRQGNTVDIDGTIGSVRGRVREGKVWRLMLDNGVFAIEPDSEVEVYR